MLTRLNVSGEERSNYPVKMFKPGQRLRSIMWVLLYTDLFFPMPGIKKIPARRVAYGWRPEADRPTDRLADHVF